MTKGGLCKLRQSAIPTKGLHIFCTEDSNDIHDPQKLHKPQLGASSNEVYENTNFTALTISPSRQQQTINDSEAHASSKPVYQESDMDLESVFDTPRKSALLRQLAKKISLQIKHSKKIKTLQQKARRLKKKNICLQKILENLGKKRFIDNDVSNILSENVSGIL
ncbi:unnamed protein product [Parnassius apollo]|uniref:(apollo) hypothetical protein n=1 Tax=Parnassius apollo TaxID=110799 RepID=A0A8S3W494_PARAO|nr:unnamed protein product [Parnassius apollo]